MPSVNLSQKVSFYVILEKAVSSMALFFPIYIYYFEMVFGRTYKGKYDRCGKMSLFVGSKCSDESEVSNACNFKKMFRQYNLYVHVSMCINKAKMAKS